VAKRACTSMEDDDNITYYEEAITPPTVLFLKNHWADICLQAAEEHSKYIVWEPRIGVRLGTFEDYKNTRKSLADIAEGLAKNIDGRDRIVVKQGGDSFQIDIQIKQLKSGESAL
jgi:hypothetical protein